MALVARTKIIDGKEIPFTPEEEAARDAEEAAWANRHIPTIDEIDTDELNKALLAEGSVIRALCEVLLQEINKLRQQAGLAQYTRPQFITALKAKMRS